MSVLIGIVGPTGSGKSELAIAVAARCNGEIVNYDSIQFYRHFDIGAAKLAPAARRGIPHHLIDILEPHEVSTAGEFARRAAACVGEIRDRGRLPVLAGGTGFYLRALLEGLFPGPTRDALLRRRLAARPPERLHRLLRRLDPASSRKIHPHDVPKMIRALEVTLLARRPISELYALGRARLLEGFTVLKLGLDPGRNALYDRINRRTDAMFACGLIEETRQIVERFGDTCKPLESHGYRQALQHLRGELSLPDAICNAQRDTRHYAKRQLTWFRREPDVRWVRGFGDDPAIQAEALTLAEPLAGGRSQQN